MSIPPPTPTIPLHEEGRGMSDTLGYSKLPSRPNSAVDNWGKRKDLLALAKLSEQHMITSHKLPARRPTSPPKFIPRLNADETIEVDNYVLAYQKRTGDAIRFETPSQTYARNITKIKAMTRATKRNELLRRGVHKNNLSTKEQSQRLAIVYTKETRRKRLQEAHIDGDIDEIQNIRAEARAFAILDRKPQVARRQVHPDYYNTPRHVFLSIAGLYRDFQNSAIPEDTWETALLVFDCDRKWVFHDKKNHLPDKFFDAQYFHFDQPFLELLSFKEEAGLVHWFRPEKSYTKMSEWFQVSEQSELFFWCVHDINYHIKLTHSSFRARLGAANPRSDEQELHSGRKFKLRAAAAGRFLVVENIAERRLEGGALLWRAEAGASLCARNQQDNKQLQSWRL